MVYDGVLLGLIVGLFRGGWRQGLIRFSQIRLIAGWMFPVLLLVQFIIFMPRKSGLGWQPLTGIYLWESTWLD